MELGSLICKWGVGPLEVGRAAIDRRGGLTKVAPDLSRLWFPSTTAPLGTMFEFNWSPVGVGVVFDPEWTDLTNANFEVLRATIAAVALLAPIPTDWSMAKSARCSRLFLYSRLCYYPRCIKCRASSRNSSRVSLCVTETVATCVAS